jgi:hypothetical protein
MKQKEVANIFTKFLDLSNFKFREACSYLNDAFQTFVPFTETEVPSCQPILTCH